MEEILGYFGTDPRRARKKYESNIIERVGRYGSGELAEDGLPRGLVGKRGLEEEKRGEVFDERVLGRGDFVESILQEAGGKPQVKASREEVMMRVVKRTGVSEENLLSRSQVREVVRARALYCYLAKERCGINGRELAREMGLTSGAISHLILRGRMLQEDNL